MTGHSALPGGGGAREIMTQFTIARHGCGGSAAAYLYPISMQAQVPAHSPSRSSARGAQLAKAAEAQAPDGQLPHHVRGARPAQGARVGYCSTATRCTSGDEPPRGRPGARLRRGRPRSGRLLRRVARSAPRLRSHYPLEPGAGGGAGPARRAGVGRGARCTRSRTTAGSLPACVATRWPSTPRWYARPRPPVGDRLLDGQRAADPVTGPRRRSWAPPRPHPQARPHPAGGDRPRGPGGRRRRRPGVALGRRPGSERVLRLVPGRLSPSRRPRRDLGPYLDTLHRQQPHAALFVTEFGAEPTGRARSPRRAPTRSRSRNSCATTWPSRLPARSSTGR